MRIEKSLIADFRVHQFEEAEYIFSRHLPFNQPTRVLASFIKLRNRSSILGKASILDTPHLYRSES